jgi:hypothetical protein
MVSFP